MGQYPTRQQFAAIGNGYHSDPSRSLSLRAEAYTDPHWHQVDLQEIIAKTWQWVCHAEKLRQPGSFIAVEIAGKPIALVRDREGTLRAFYNVCKHRAHKLLSGEGSAAKIMCPYHAWTYGLDGQLLRAPHTEHLQDFDPKAISLEPVLVEEFCGFIFVNLDTTSDSLSAQSGSLESEIRHWAPDIDSLTFGHRLTYDIKSNWKNVVDNFLECYHCHVAHSDFCDLVDMRSYRSICHGIYSSHCGRSRQAESRAYRYSDGERARRFGSWWLWPNLCIEVFPGAPNVNIFHHVPVGPEQTRHVFEFYMQSPVPTPEQEDAIRYIDQVLQAEDIALVESVQRGLKSRGYDQGRFIVDADRTDMSEHAVHHFHALVVEAMARRREGA